MRSRPSTLDQVLAGTAYAALTTALVWLAAGFGGEFLAAPRHSLVESGDVIGRMANWDGQWYRRLADEGYSYDVGVPSSVAFFPAFPLLGRFVAMCTGLRTDAALLVVSHLSLAGACVIALAYVRQRFPHAEPDLADWVVLALALYPMGIFFRAAYTESLFLLVTIAALYGMHARWPAVAVAAIVGLATAIRPVGVALVPALAWWLWRESRSWRGFCWRAVLCAPLAVWGLAAYMVYLEAAFDDPLAFARTQQHWRARPAYELREQLVALATFEPIWGTYVPGNPAYWARHELHANPLLSLQFTNPLFFLLCGALVAVGAWKRWLTSYEWLAAAGMLAIPYLLQSYPMYMAGAARHSAALWPVYLVLGCVLARAPRPLAALLLAGSAALMVFYAALFAAWHRVF